MAVKSNFDFVEWILKRITSFATLPVTITTTASLVRISLVSAFASIMALMTSRSSLLLVRLTRPLAVTSKVLAVE